MTPSRGNGIIDIPSHHSVDETVEKLKGILQAKGVTLFALVDHSGEPGLYRMARPLRSVSCAHCASDQRTQTTTSR